jgi:nucleoside-diphosphate-sugar epimerase
MRVAMTGTGGFLGGALLRRLRDEGVEVIALTTSPSSCINQRAIFWKPTHTPEECADVLANVDVFVHCGAYIPENNNDPGAASKCYEANALGTLNLLRACELTEVRRFIYVSGCNSLRARTMVIREDDPVGCEHSPYYLGSKVLGEIYVRAQIARGLNGLIVRPTSIYGPGMKRGVILALADRIRMCLPVRLANNGNWQADYVWCNDVVNVLSQAVFGKQSGEVNLGSGQTTTLVKLAEQLVKFFKAEDSLIHYSSSGAHDKNFGFSAVDIARARAWFDFQPMLLEHGLLKWFGGEASDAHRGLGGYTRKR